MDDSSQKSAPFNPRPPRPPWGIRPQPRKAISLKHPIRVIPPPETVVIPIEQCLGMSAEPVVSVGDHVQTGQPVAAALQGSGNARGPLLHASVTGTVSAIKPVPLSGTGADPQVCIVIDSQGNEEKYAGYSQLGDPLAMTPDELCRHIETAGIVGLGGALYSTADKLRTQQPIEVLIINGAECEPYITCDEILMRERAAEIVRGSRIMLHALGAPLAVIAVESDMPEARVALYDAIEAEGCDNIRVAVVTAKYPAGGERQLIELITEREVPDSGLPADIGIVCHNVGTAAAVTDLFERGQPMISRIVTVTGRGITEPANLEVRIGTPIEALFPACGGLNDDIDHLIMGGPMMGIALTDSTLPVTKATNCLIVMQTGDVSPEHEEMPCIRCGECLQVCPARLLPQELLTATRRNDMEALVEFGLEACIECGCCDYVCPSQIRLTGRFIEAKPALRQYHADRQKAARAQARHAARDVRRTNEQDNETAILGNQTNANKESIAAIMERTRDREKSAD